ncbi:hypothetical protein M0802_010268 [Mischocyttarus mexicanus]|nr:hypothetical protein M0802_010268 [Mischocyttarus mexicanus]
MIVSNKAKPVVATLRSSNIAGTRQNSKDQLSFMKETSLQFLPLLRVQNRFKITSEQRRIRPDTPLIDEEIGGSEDRMNEKEQQVRYEELDKRKHELEIQKKELEEKERRLELREDEICRSVGVDFNGFRSFEQATNTGRLIYPSPTLPLPAPRTVHASIKLREITETVPKLDGHNIAVSQFARCCRRTLDSLPLDFTSETEISLTTLLIFKLSGHAYVVVENLKITRLEQLIERLKDAFLPSHSSNFYRGQLATEIKKPGEHVLDYFSRIRELTQSIIEIESKQVGCLERRVERKIEE